MGGGLAAGAFFLGGQMQGQQQLQMYQQQMQMRMMEEQLRRAALLQQIKQTNDQQAAMKTLPPDQQKAMNLGESYADIQKRQDQGSRVDFARSQILSSSSLSPEQKIGMLKSLSIGNVGDVERALSVKPPKPTLLVGPGGVPVAWDGTGPPPAGAVTPGLYDKEYEVAHRRPEKETDIDLFEHNRPEWLAMQQAKQQFGAKGATGAEADMRDYLLRHPEANREQARDALKASASAAAASGKGLSPTEKKSLESIDSAQRLGEELKGIAANLQNATPGQLASQYAKYRAPWGVLGPNDPQYSAYFNNLGQLQTDLIGAATSGNSRAIALVKMLEPHIPKPTDPPARALEKLQGFEAGRFETMRQAIKEGGNYSGSATSSAALPSDLKDMGGGYLYSPSTGKYFAK